MYIPKNQKVSVRPEVKKARTRDFFSGFFKTFLIIAAVFAIIAGLFKLCEKAVTSEDCLVKTIVVEGNHSAKKEEIIARGKLTANMSIYFLKPDKIREGILTHPDIEKAEIEREVPDKLIIRVKEREAMVILKTPSGRTLPLDKKGHILSANKLETAMNLPVVLTDKELVPSEKECGDAKILAALDYLFLMRHAPERNFIKVKTVDTREKDALIFKTVSIDEILLSEEYSSEAVAKIFEVVKNLRETGRGAAKIDARYEDVAVICKYL